MRDSSGASAETGGSSGLLSLWLLVITLLLDSGATGCGLLLLEGCGDDVAGERELLDEVLHTLVGDGVVSPLPAEDLLEEAL